MESYNKGIKRAALISATLSAFATPFMAASINIALPSISKEFQMDAVVLSWVSTSFLLTTAILLIPFGKMADLYGRKKIYIIGLIIYTLASAVTPLAMNSFVLILFRILQGIGGSMIFVTGMAIITSVFPPGERGKAIGINIAAVYTGLSLGPFIGGILTQHFGWRSVFFFNIPIGLIPIFFVIIKLKEEWKTSEREKFDLVGSLMLAIALSGIIYGFSIIKETYGKIILIIGMLFLIFFILYEKRIPNPVLNVRLFAENRVFAFSNLAALINYSATFTVTFLLSLYLQYIKMLTPQEAGFILVAQPIMMAIFSPLAGRLSDKINARYIATFGMALSTIGLIILIFLNEDTQIIIIITALIVLGIGFGLFSSPNTNSIMSSVDKKSYGQASATVSEMRLLGQMFSMGIVMLIFSIFIGNEQITHQYHTQLMKSMNIIFTISSFLCIIGIFASLSRGSDRV